ncbi:MAG: acyl-ACP thioesterase-domain-containing protein [Monoraphidium minutum]|nr:MAG: acyl-ACP thioesterase-domain-containing protein [Monoraphidium minutum]
MLYSDTGLRAQHRQQRAAAAAPVAAPGSSLIPARRPRLASIVRAAVVEASAGTAERARCELQDILPTPSPSAFLNNSTSFIEEFRIRCASGRAARGAQAPRAGGRARSANGAPQGPCAPASGGRRAPTPQRGAAPSPRRRRGNECGPDQHANIITIANLLQEVGGNHGVALWGRADSGFASMPGMDHLIFVATRMQIRMEAYPKWGDLVRLETYFAEDGRLCTRRDWHITDAVTGAYLGAATSTWVTINSETRKLSKLPEEIRARWLNLAPSPARLVLPVADTKRKLQDFPEAPALAGPLVTARRTDMDPNGHNQQRVLPQLGAGGGAGERVRRLPTCARCGGGGACTCV